MKILIRVAWVLGLGLMVGLFVRAGVAPILELLSQAGWVLIWLIPLHALPLLLDALGWRALLSHYRHSRMLFAIAAVREAINRLLPVANIGGEIVGIRLLAQLGVPGPEAAASVVVEVSVTLLSQFLFVALGVACLMQLTGLLRLAGAWLGLLGAVLPLLVALFLALRSGRVFGWLQRLAARLLGNSERILGLARQSAQLDAEIRRLCREPGRLGLALAWQLAGLVTGCIETWLALRWLGHPVGTAASVAIESLTQAARQFIFIVPAGLGVQEASLIGLGELLGVGSGVALALSLVKRMREIIFGVPALLAWQWFEGRRDFLHVRSRSNS
jgi:putative membrane protein